jgi:hypothetical protein
MLSKLVLTAVLRQWGKTNEQSAAYRFQLWLRQTEINKQQL